MDAYRARQADLERERKARLDELRQGSSERKR
jgi:hypothetical protein